jgi:hypothetical protein
MDRKESFFNNPEPELEPVVLQLQFGVRLFRSNSNSEPEL